MNVRIFPVLALAALALSACGKSPEAAPLGPGDVAVRADEHGFTPSSVTATKGKPLALVFTRTTDKTCATAVAFPDLKIEKPLPKDTPVRIELPTAEAKTYTFQCGMGMYKSKVVVQ
jgi:plastocyanin domain-containing protein